jgi:Tfp pilus assembly protein PilN
VSLGAFVTEDAAKARLADVVRLGAANARVGPRQQVFASTVFVIRDPQAPVIARLRDLVPAFAGSEAKIGNCEKVQ